MGLPLERRRNALVSRAPSPPGQVVSRNMPITQQWGGMGIAFVNGQRVQVDLNSGAHYPGLLASRVSSTPGPNLPRARE